MPFRLTGLIDYRDAYDYAFDYWQDGQAYRPSREPPHLCALGRAKGGVKVKAVGHRREFACLGYCTVAPRLPSGTLVNKTRQQAQRCLVMGYSGSETGAYERLGPSSRVPSLSVLGK